MMKLPMFMHISCIFAFATGVICLLSPFTTDAAKAKQMSLREIVDICGVAFEGECIAVNSGKDPRTGMIATWYTFRVHEPLYGELDETFILKQFGGTDGTTTVAMHSAGFSEDETVILFVYPPSRSGFSSAVGLTQGKFSITTIEDSPMASVSNGSPVALLFESADTFPQQVAAIDAEVENYSPIMTKNIDKDEFKSIVTRMLEQRQEDAETR